MKALQIWNQLTHSQFWQWFERWFDDPNNRSFGLEVVKTVVSVVQTVVSFVVGSGD